MTRPCPTTGPATGSTWPAATRSGCTTCQTRDLIATYALPGAQSLALDRADHRVYIGHRRAELIATIDTAEELDPLRTANPPPAPTGTIPPTLANLGVAINAAVGQAIDGSVLVAGTSASNTVAIDPATNGAIGQTVHVDGLADLAAGGLADGLVVTPSAITDPTAEASHDRRDHRARPGDRSKRACARSPNQAGSTQTAVLGSIPSTGQATSIPSGDLGWAPGRLRGPAPARGRGRRNGRRDVHRRRRPARRSRWSPRRAGHRPGRRRSASIRRCCTRPRRTTRWQS